MSKSNWTRRGLIWGGGAAIAALVLVWASRPQPVAADLGVVERAPLQVTLDQEGRTRVRRRFVVSAPVAGRLLRVELEPGDRVTAGTTVVARLRPDDAPLLDARARATAEARVGMARAAVLQAEATLDQARRAAEFAERERDRMNTLFDQDIVSARDRDMADAEAVARSKAVDVAQAGLEASQRELDVAQAALSPSPANSGGAIDMRAPVDGIVLRRVQESESAVQAGQNIVEIGDLEDLEIVADYLSSDAVQLAAGMPALVDRWGGDDPLGARVRLVEPAGFVKISALGVEEQRVNVILAFDEPYDDRRALGDGFRVEVRVILFSDEVLAIPSSALFRRGDGWAAFVLDADGVATARDVEVGRRTGLLSEVLGGVSAGDRVVLHPSGRIEDGVMVQAR